MNTLDSNPLQKLSWKETKHRIRHDYFRLVEERSSRSPFVTGASWLSISFLSVVLFRLSNHSFRAGYNWLSRGLWHLNIVLTGADISPPADIGEGLVVYHPAGTTIMGSIGKNFTVMACSGVGGEVGRHETVAHWPGVPLIGDDVVLEAHSGVLGPVRIGNRVRVCSGAIVMRHVDDDMIVESPRVRIVRTKNNDTA